MKLIVVRHGRSEENEQGRINGHTDANLSLEGKRQIQRVAEELCNVRIDAIYSSDLKRSIDTATAIRKYHKGIPLVTKPELKEINTGKFEGRRILLPESVVAFMTRVAIRLSITPPGGESWKSLKCRVLLFLDDVYKVHKDNTILIVTHGATMQAIRYCVEEGKNSSYLGRTIPNCTVWYLDMAHSIKVL